MKAPSANLQAPEKIRNLILEIGQGRWLEIFDGRWIFDWRFIGGWSLEFGVCRTGGEA